MTLALKPKKLGDPYYRVWYILPRPVVYIVKLEGFANMPVRILQFKCALNGIRKFFQVSVLYI